LCGYLYFSSIPSSNIKTEKGNLKVSIGKQITQYKTIEVKPINTLKQQTTLSSYLDNNKSRYSLSHRLRLNEKWSFRVRGTTQIGTRRNNNSVSCSVTKNW
jgi:hypothetical protein